MDMNYGGFWRRLTATLVDLALIGLVTSLLLVPVLAWLGIREERSPSETRSAFFTFLLAAYSLTTLVVLILTWLYYALMESSRHGATLGKKIMGLYVTTLAGDPVSFGTASARFFAKIISSALLGAGFIIQPFTPLKQALHDIMARTLVLRQKSNAMASSAAPLERPGALHSL